MAAPKQPRYSELRGKARVLRKQGLAFSQIAERLGISQQRAFQLNQPTKAEKRQQQKEQLKTQAQDLRKEIGWNL